MGEGMNNPSGQKDMTQYILFLITRIPIMNPLRTG